MRTLAILALLLTSLAGCASSPYFRPHAFVPPLRHYRVRYDDVGARRVLSPEWQVLNFRSGQVAPGRDWVTTRSVDEGGGPRTRTIPLFDLFAEHERDGAVLFVMTVPLDLTMGRRDLRIVAHEFIDELAGSAVAVVRRARGAGSEERLVASRLVEDTVAEIGSAEAYLVTLERRVVGSSSVTASRTMTFVLIRPHRRWRASGVADERGAPMLVMVGLESTTERHAAHRRELDGLLDRLDVRPIE